MGALNWDQGPLALVDWTGPAKRLDGAFVCQRKERTREMCCPFKRFGVKWVLFGLYRNIASHELCQDHKRPDGWFSPSQWDLVLKNLLHILHWEGVFGEKGISFISSFFFSLHPVPYTDGVPGVGFQLERIARPESLLPTMAAWVMEAEWSSFWSGGSQALGHRSHQGSRNREQRRPGTTGGSREVSWEVQKSEALMLRSLYSGSEITRQRNPEQKRHPLCTGATARNFWGESCREESKLTFSEDFPGSVFSI